MIKKKLLSLVLLALSLVSCSNSGASSHSPNESQSSEILFSSADDTSEAEEADPYGFDPNLDYIGTSATDFEVMASRYVANPQFVPEPFSMEGDYYVRTILDFGIITFPFRGSSVVAYHRGGKIIELHRFQSGKMTIGEAKTLGYAGEAQEKQSEGYVYFRAGGKASSTKRYERDLDQRLGNFSHLDGQGRFEGIEKYIDLFARYGIPTSMLVYYDGMADDYINDMEGHGYLGLAVDYASAIPVYSDDLCEIVGAMTIGYCFGDLRKAFTYLKEDGFGRIKKAKEMITQVGDPEVNEIQNPRFYVEDTSLLPKGDWRIILGGQNSV